MSAPRRAGAPASAGRYAEFRDASGSWRFEIREYREDLDPIVPGGVPPDPDPKATYRAAVFIEGLVQDRKRAGNWSDDALDRFDSFESTVEVEAVAKALRGIGGSAAQ